MQHAACGLYAFCREADDLVDEGDDPKAALELLHHRLDKIYEAKPEYRHTDRVLTQIVHTYHMPRGLLNALLKALLGMQRARSITQSMMFTTTAPASRGLSVS